MPDRSAEEVGSDHSRVVNHRLVPPAGVYDLDPVHTFVGFRAQHLVVGRVRGRFDRIAGAVTIAEDPLGSSVEVTIETASINTLMPFRDDDLRSARFLNVAEHPTMSYRSTAITEIPEREWSVLGDMTVRGVTRPVGLVVQFGGSITDAHGKIRAAFHAHTAITRSDFGLTNELVQEAGGLLVGKDVSIDIDAEAVQRT